MHSKMESVLQARLPLKGISRVLVCRPNHRLGNNLLMTPLITEIERLFKDVEIDIVSEGQAARSIFSTAKSVKHIYCLPVRGFKHPAAFLALLHRIRQNRYDLIIDPCVGSGFSRALTRVLRGRFKLGFVGSNPAAKSSGLTHGVPDTAAGPHMAKRPINLLLASVSDDATRGPTRFGQSFPPLDLRLSEDERQEGERRLAKALSGSPRDSNAPVIGLFANATGIKRYPKAWWIEFVETLSRMLPACSFIEFIPIHGNSMLDSQWPVHYAPDIRVTAAVMAATSVIISADCGAMHLAVASGAPTIGLFARDNLERYAPYGEDNFALSTYEQTVGETAREVAATLFKMPLFDDIRLGAPVPDGQNSKNVRPAI